MLTQLTERRRRIEAGEASLGWKLGMGVPAAMAKLGTDAPLVGYLLERARVDDGATVSLDGWSNPKLEPEIAVHLGGDLAPGASREEASEGMRRACPRRRRQATGLAGVPNRAATKPGSWPHDPRVRPPPADACVPGGSLTRRR